MNWQKTRSTAHTIIMVGGLSIGSGIFYAVVVVGICRLVFKLSDNTALWVGGISFVAFIIWSIIYLPKHLRKVGLIE